MTGLKYMARKALNRLGVDVRRVRATNDGVWSNPPSRTKHQRIFPAATYSPWLDDQAFLNVYRRIKNHTLVDIYRCYELWSLAKQTSRVDGHILEVGVWRGGTGAILAEAVKDLPKKVYLADTFTGVVKAGPNDPSYTGGEHSDTSLTVVKTLMDSLTIGNTELLQGVFPEDTQDRVHGKIALLHSDVDVYSSTRDIVQWCLPRLSVGSVLVFDDYGFSGCEGVTAYCDEFRNQGTFCFLYNLNGHAVLIKTRE